MGSRSAAGVLLAIILCLACAPSEEPSPAWSLPLRQEIITADEFTRVVASAIQSEADVGSVEVLKSLIVTVKSEHGELDMNVQNNFRGLDSMTFEERVLEVRHVVDAVGPLLESVAKDIEPSEVLPLVRSQRLVGELRETFPEDSILVEPLVGRLWVVYVRDLPDSLKYLQVSDLATLGIDMEELRMRALANLRGTATASLETVQNGTAYRLSLDGTYDESLLLLDDLWQGLEREVRGDLVVALPERGSLYYTGALEESGLFTLHQVLTGFDSDARNSLASHLLQWTGGGWIERPDLTSSDAAQSYTDGL